MSEYIEREAAIAMYEDDEIDMGALKVPVPVIVQNLKDVPAADVWEVRWIPVKERLPNDREHIIVCTKTGNVGEAIFQAALDWDLYFPEVWFVLNDYGNQYQTEELKAWMPLPAPPKEETE